MSRMLGLGVPKPRCCGARPVGRGLSGADVGIGLAPRRLAGPIRRLCGERRGGPR